MARKWMSAARPTSETSDLRDAKISITPGGRLMLIAAGALHDPDAVRHQTYVWFSIDGYQWSDPQPIGEPNFWMWRVVWHNDVAYGVGCATHKDLSSITRLYRNDDGAHYNTLVDKGYSNEVAIVFQPDETAWCLMRRDGDDASAQLGTSKSPCDSWSRKDLGVRVGGPQMVRPKRWTSLGDGPNL